MLSGSFCINYAEKYAVWWGSDVQRASFFVVLVVVLQAPNAFIVGRRFGITVLIEKQEIL